MLEIFFISLAIFATALLAAAAVSTLHGFLIGAPLLYSPKGAIEEALQKVNSRPGENFYDLGMGSGRALIIAAHKFGLRVTGFEMSPLIFWLAKINLFFNRVQNPRLHRSNFYDQDLSGADIIFCFLSPKAMERLKPKFERELKKGTRVISYSFRIKDWQEKLILSSGTPGKVFIYLKP